jgi:selenocysteine lyase/cysteine desulfurase
MNSLKQKLDERNIYVSVRGTAIRISPNVYNNEEDITALFDILKTLSKK